MSVHGGAVGTILWAVSVGAVAVLVVTSWAHVLELPGKRRLDREEYLVVQRIYYPGFTIAGLAEPLGLLVTAWWALDHTVRAGVPVVGWIAVCLLVAGQAIYWHVIHPLNQGWLEQEETGRAAATFFAVGGRFGADWRWRRDRWEGGHAARAVLVLVALGLLLVTGAAP